MSHVYCYAECRDAECRIFSVMLRVVVVIILSVVAMPEVLAVQADVCGLLFGGAGDPFESVHVRLCFLFWPGWPSRKIVKKDFDKP